MSRREFVYAIAILLFFVSCSLRAGSGTTEVDVGEFKVKLYNDGSGIFGRPNEMNPLDNHWSLGGRDEMTDKLDNSAYRMGQVVVESIPGRVFPARVGLRITVNKGQNPKICVVGHDFPGRTTMFRVGSNPAVTTNQDGCATLSKSLEAQLRNGSTAKVQGVKWPDALPNRGDVNLDGFGALIDWLRKRS